MHVRQDRRALTALCLWLGTCLAVGGCAATGVNPDQPAPPLPAELQKVVLPPYTISPPDILELDAVTIVPKPPYRLNPFDMVYVQITDLLPPPPPAPPTTELNQSMVVLPEGTLNFGTPYGQVRVAGLTMEEAQQAIQTSIRRLAAKANVTLSLLQPRGLEQIRGPHLVNPDGTINLGLYGSVVVAGMTVPQARAAIEEQLSATLQKPEVAVTVVGYNSKVYYVVFDGAGYGEQIVRRPIMGSETVLDAISDLGGLPAQTSPHHVYLVRPAPGGMGCDQVLPVCWEKIVHGGETATNYQLLPGDRIHVESDTLTAMNNWINKIVAPVERVFGITILGSGMVQQLEGRINNGNGTGGGL